jgi:F0F1-type ATP synthase assembly protein I
MAFPFGGGQKGLWAQVAFYSSLGFIIPGGAVGGYFFGWFLDEHLHTTPVLGIIGGLAGTAGGIVEVLQLVTRAEKRSEDGNDSSGGSGRR